MTRIDTTLIEAARLKTGPHAVVIGAGLGGLASAMRLGAMGYRVTVMDRLDVPGGRGSAIWKEGHRFDLGPTIVTVPQIFRELWAACGRKLEDYIDLRPLDPFYEIRWPDGSKFEASGDTERMVEEVRRLSPGDVAGYRKFLQDSEARYWFGFEDLGRRSMHRLRDLIAVLPTFARMRADRSVYAHAARRVRDERLRMALSFHPLFIGGDPFNVTSMYILVSHLEKEFGVYYAMGGVAEMARVMANIVSEQGGAVRMETEVDEILFDGDCATGVRLADGEEIRADLVVSNADAGWTYSKLMRNRPKKRWTDPKLDRSRWSMGLFVWYFGTKGTRDMWPDVGHHTILNGPRYKGLVKDIFINGKLSDDMSLYVHRPSVTDPSVAPDGDDTFYVLSPVPHLGHDNGVDWTTQREVYRKKVEQVLETQLLPGLAKHLGPEEILTPLEFKSRYNAPHGTGFSIEPRILQSAWFRPHNVSEEADGLFLTGAGTHPGAGLPGVISSAEVLAQLVPVPSEVDR
ncbi:Phytoene desaturase (neurosporene-forming) [Roseivivax sp. THAF40]|uniref:phytoene desaturase n=1 Tax=unclassified Roseivivax TaxID=2639302 RepID=UPI0012691D9E|nr:MULTISPECIES: phytoene desaturase [unclassified Roseivivax]QFS84743.1 Phytoene desaturase (neurosporene-forming) [Roseivivax sp. THAF197b]QFT48570.1 Phytoene desaturase (neurosporene-forming) [Roseivivax sp. THAF40]